MMTMAMLSLNIHGTMRNARHAVRCVRATKKNAAACNTNKDNGSSLVLRRLPLGDAGPRVGRFVCVTSLGRSLGSVGRSIVTLRGLVAARAGAGARPDADADHGNNADPLSNCVVNFYHLVDIERPHEMLDRHRAYMKDKDVRGRIYISEQGVNAQYGGETGDAVGYAEWLTSDETESSYFAGLNYSVEPVPEHMFPKLRLQYKPNLISLAGGMAGVPVTDPESRATKVPPEKWREMLTDGINGKRPVVLDVRNAYEWDAGHFAGAERPIEDNFNQTPTDLTDDDVPYHLQNVDEDADVMMYCTGGIRCDVYSAYLKRKGFKNLYTLEGGIQNYMRKEGLDHWNGSLYVFDGRMAVRPNKENNEPLVAAARCLLCGEEAVLPHLNCSNVDCNKLCLACDACKRKYVGCCCEACTGAPRKLRPIQPEVRSI